MKMKNSIVLEHMCFINMAHSRKYSFALQRKKYKTKNPKDILVQRIRAASVDQ